MLGKRVRWIPAEGDGAKRLRANLDDLWASGQTSTGRHTSLIRDGFDAGVESCWWLCPFGKMGFPLTGTELKV